MQSIGVDIVEIDRIEQAVSRWGERFLRRVFTEAELQVCRQRVSELAARFAGKEAVMKVLGTGNRGTAWREIEILSNFRGKPLVFLHGRAKERAERMGIRVMDISLSHSKEFAIASAIGDAP